MDKQKETIGEIVKNTRLKQNLSQGEVAQKASIQQSYLSHIERDTGRPPSVYVIEKIAFALGLETKKLIKLLEIERFKYEQQRLNNKRKGLSLKAPNSHFRPIPILKEVPNFIPDNLQDFPSEIIIGSYEPAVKDPKAFMYEVEGDFMAPEIKKGDLLLIYPSEIDKVKNGDIVVITNGKKVRRLRRVTFEGNEIILSPENSAYPIIVWKKEDKPKIIGRVKEIIRRR